jgi:sialidase-1
MALTIASSSDDGVTWSDVEVLADPFIVGEGELNHGIELQRGPHRGRWVLPYCKASIDKNNKYAARALAAYSDNGGKNWTQGALTPAYSGEAAITELGNGSVLISFRMEGEHMPSHPHSRGFARSDDGGATWAEIWYANDPGRATGMIDGPSDQGIDRSEKTGAVYFGHPGSLTERANYTIHRSLDEGATFEFVGVIFPAGAGYSDVHVLPGYDGPGDRLGVAFQRCLNDPSREGGGYNMAWASMTILP